LLPDAEHVPGGVAECRHLRIALRIGLRHHVAALSNDLLSLSSTPSTKIYGRTTGLSDNRRISHEMPDHVAGPVLEARIFAISVDFPAEPEYHRGRE
jgi:hypothetical protein